MKETEPSGPQLAMEQTEPAGFSGYWKSFSGSLNRHGMAAGVSLLVLVGVIWACWNWGTWGDLSTDCGREVLRLSRY